MARHIEDVTLNQPIDVVSMVMEDYVYHHHFSRSDWQGEPVYQATDSHGKDWYMNYHYANGVFHMEAWLKGPFGDEMDLSGIGGGKSRQEFRESIDNLLQKLRAHSGNTAAGHIGQDPVQHHTAPQPAPSSLAASNPSQAPYQPSPLPYAGGQQVPYQPSASPYAGGQQAPYQSPMAPNPNGQLPYQPQSNGLPFNPYAPTDNSLAANSAFGLGITALILSFILPVLGIIFACISMSNAKTGMESSAAGKAKTGRTLSIIAIVIAIVMLVMQYFIYFTL